MPCPRQSEEAQKLRPGQDMPRRDAIDPLLSASGLGSGFILLATSRVTQGHLVLGNTIFLTDEA